MFPAASVTTKRVGRALFSWRLTVVDCLLFDRAFASLSSYNRTEPVLRIVMQSLPSTSGRQLHATARTDSHPLPRQLFAHKSTHTAACSHLSATSVHGQSSCVPTIVSALRGCAVQQQSWERRSSVRAAARPPKDASGTANYPSAAVPDDLELPSHCCGCGIKLQLADARAPGWVGAQATKPCTPSVPVRKPGCVQSQNIPSMSSCPLLLMSSACGQRAQQGLSSLCLAC